MEKPVIKKGVKKAIYCNLPYIILMTLFIVIMFKIDFNYGDEIVHKTQFLGLTPLQLVIRHYKEWGSFNTSVFLDYFFVFVHENFFRISSILIIILALFSVDQLVNSEGDIAVKWIVGIFFLLYPYYHMGSAGWIVTSVYYFFPLAFALYASTSITRNIYGKKINYFFSSLSIVLATGSIQVLLILSGAFIVFSIYFYLKKKEYVFFVVEAIMSLLGVVTYYLSPGVKNRYGLEIISCFQDFEMLSITDKINNGLIDTLQHFVYQPNVFFTFFTFLIFLYVLLKDYGILEKIIGTIPFIFVLFFGTLRGVGAGIFPQVVNGQDINIYNYFVLAGYTKIFICIFVFVITCAGVYIVFQNEEKAIVMVLVVVAGFLSRMIMCFSPTLYASSYRTFIYMYFCLIVTGSKVGGELIKIISVKQKNVLISISSIIAMIFYMNSLLIVN